MCCCPPQGRELLRKFVDAVEEFTGCCPPQGRELLQYSTRLHYSMFNVAVPRRGASCYGA